MSKKKSKSTPQQLKRQQYEQFRKKQKVIAQQYKNKLQPFAKFMKKKQLKFNHASIGQTRVEYFRLDQFEKFMINNKQEIQQNQQLNKLASNIRSQFIYYKRPEHLKVKYPNKLQPIDPSSNDKKFASFRFDTTQSKKWLIISLISIVFMLVLLPIWPYELKYALWLISFILLVFLTSLIILRLVIYLLCSIFGYNVWILPNLLGDYGIWGSITPVIYYEKWQHNLFNILIRVFLLSSFIAGGCYFYLNPDSFYQNIQTTKSVVNDIHDWGVEKIKNEKNFSQRAITNLDVILNETADIQNHQKQSQHTEFEQPSTQQNNNKQTNL